MTDSAIISESYRHCEALVRAHDKDRYLASLFAPTDVRRFLHSLYAFDIETARVRYAVREPLAGVIRLQWWHDALSGLRGEEASASPVMMALLDATEQTGTNLSPLLRTIDARQSELQGEKLADTQGAILIVAAHLLGAEGHALIDAARAADKAMQRFRRRDARRVQSISCLSQRSAIEGAAGISADGVAATAVAAA